MKQTIKQLLDSKGPEVWTIAPGATVYDAIAQMAEFGVGALPVVDDGALVGIVTERDYARKVVLQDRSSRTTTVGEVMSSEVVSANPGQTVQDCMEMMTQRRFRHLPVVDDDRLIGMVSVGDLVKAVIRDQQFEIEQLETYIRG